MTITKHNVVVVSSNYPYPFQQDGGIVFKRKDPESLRKWAMDNQNTILPFINEHGGPRIGYATNFQFMAPHLFADISYPDDFHLAELIDKTGYNVSTDYFYRETEKGIQAVDAITAIVAVFGRARCSLPVCGIQPGQDSANPLEIRYTAVDEAICPIKLKNYQVKKQVDAMPEEEKKKEEKEKKMDEAEEKKTEEKPKSEEKKTEADNMTTIKEIGKAFADAFTAQLKTQMADFFQMNQTAGTKKAQAGANGTVDLKKSSPNISLPKYHRDSFNWRKKEGNHRSWKYEGSFPRQVIEEADDFLPDNEELPENAIMINYYGEDEEERRKSLERHKAYYERVAKAKAKAKNGVAK